MAQHQAGASKFLDDRGYTGHLIRGQAPYLLIEEAVRNRIINTYYFKEQCFGLNAATLCDRAAELRFVGGTFGRAQHASPFLCLAFKLLQLNPEREIVDLYLAQTDFKYLRALAAFYVRITAERSEDVFRRLEPLLLDARKLRRRVGDGYRLSYMDEFVDDLLTRERVCATSLWKLVAREQLEDEDKLEERVSPLQHMLESEDEDGDGRRGSSDRSRAASDASSRRRSSSNDDSQRANGRRRRRSYSSDKDNRDGRRRSYSSDRERRRHSPSSDSPPRRRSRSDRSDGEMSE